MRGAYIRLSRMMPVPLGYHTIIPRCFSTPYTVNLLSKSPVGSPSGTACSRGALPMCLLEGRLRRRLRLGMGGCFAFFVATASIRCRRVACHGSANRSLPPSRLAQRSQPGWPAQEVHVGLDRSARFATDLAVLYSLLCSCACVPLTLSRAVPVGVEGKNNHYFALAVKPSSPSIVDSTVR